MAEAQLELDITPALASIEEINAAFEQTVANLSSELDSVFTDALSSQIADISSQLDAAFSSLPDEINAAFAAQPIDLNIDTPDLTAASDQFGQLEEQMDSVGETSEKVRGAFNIQEGATSALEVATGTLEGQTGSLLRTVLPGVAIFGGITAAVAGLVEKGDKAVLATERMNRVFGDQAPGIFDNKIQGINLTLGELDKKNGTSGTSLKLLLATFGQTAVSAGATREEAAGVAQSLGFVTNYVTALNPALGTADQNFTMLSRGLGGSTRLLQRYGITIDPVRQKLLALENAHKSGREVANLYDKQTAGLTLTLESLEAQAKANGHTMEQELNGALESSTVKFRALKQEISATLTKFGTPIVEAGLAITTAFTPAIEGIIGLFGGLVDAIVPVLAPIATKIANAIQPAIDAIPGFVTKAEPAIHAFGEVLSGIADLFAPVVDWALQLARALGSVASPFIIGFFHGVRDALIEVKDAVSQAATWIQDKLGISFSDLLPQLGDAKQGASDLGEKLGGAAVVAAGAAGGFAILGVGIDTVSTVVQTLGAGLDLLAANPWIAVVALLAVGFYELYQNSEDFRKGIEVIGNYFENSFLPDLRELVTELGNIGEIMEKYVLKQWHEFEDVLGAISDTNTFKAIEDIANALADLYDQLELIGQVLLIITGLGIGAFLLTLVAPVGLLTAGIGLVVAAAAGLALVFVVAYAKIKPFHDIVDNVISRIGDLAVVIGDRAQPVLDAIGSTVAAAAVQFDALVPKIEQIVGVVVDVIQIAMVPFIAMFNVLLDFISNAVAPVFDFLEATIITVFDSIKNTVQGAINIIMGIFSLFINLLTGDWQGAWDSLKQIVEGVWQAIQGIVGLVLGQLLNLINLGLGLIGAVFRTAWDTIKSVLSSAWDGIKLVVSTAIDFVKTIITTQFDLIKAIFSGVWNGIKTTFSGIWDGIKFVVTTGIAAIIGFFTDIPGKIAGSLGGLADLIKAPFVSAFNGIKALWNNTLGGFGFTVPDWIPGIGGDEFKIPKMHGGGIVPGRLGEEVLTILQAGERVQSVDQVNNSTQPIQVNLGGILVQAAPNMSRDDATQIGIDVGAAASREIITAVGTV